MMAFAASALASPSGPTPPTDAQVAQWLENTRFEPTTARIEDFSARFLGLPYGGDKFGEGLSGEYDQDPLYRFDTFDCTTYVETIMALALAPDFARFTETLNRIRYRDGHISYVTRNHFPEADWIPNNVAAGFYDEITDEVGAAAGIELEIAEALVDKRALYEHKKISELNVSEPDPEKRLEILRRWRREGRVFRKELVRLNFLRLTRIFEKGADDVLARIPSGSILNIVTPGWNITDPEDGSHITQMNISHQGLVIVKNGIRYLRHASQETKAVVDMPLKAYLERYLQSKKIKGIALGALVN